MTYCAWMQPTYTLSLASVTKQMEALVVEASLAFRSTTLRSMHEVAIGLASSTNHPRLQGLPFNNLFSIPGKTQDF